MTQHTTTYLRQLRRRPTPGDREVSIGCHDLRVVRRTRKAHNRQHARPPIRSA